MVFIIVVHWFKRSPLLLITAVLTFSAPAGSQHQQAFNSGPQQVSLVELYTSEGCSSCPPADRWLSSLRQSSALWNRFVPVAFHVDYWDYLGWRDRFSKKAYTTRQRAYASLWNSRTIYTPGFVVDGNEWRNWGGNSFVSRLSSQQTGSLSAHVNGQTVSVTFKPEQQFGSLKGHVALLAMDVQSDVAAGENRGRELKHDFVVLDHQMAGLQKKGETFSGALSVNQRGFEEMQLAVAIWVSHRGRPIQSTGGLLK